MVIGGAVVNVFTAGVAFVNVVVCPSVVVVVVFDVVEVDAFCCDEQLHKVKNIREINIAGINTLITGFLINQLPK
jgi:hypothetical protein